MKTAADIESFIADFPEEVQKTLNKLRAVIQKAAPDAQEAINYGIPTFKLKGNLVHFSAYKNHIGFYPGASPIAAFADDLAAYETSKGTVKFPIGTPIPFELITQIVKFRVEENLKKAETKKNSGTKTSISKAENNA
jgi:uncharacterized protein YdhG (YjbR/CyaY superfamily)